MEWVERTDRTVEAAKDFLLDQLGVDEDEAEFEILEEPKPGLFGRVRGQARVRARVAPRAPRAKEDRNRRPRSKSADGGRRKPSRPAAQKAESAPKAESSRPEPREQREPREPRQPRQPAGLSGGNGGGGSGHDSSDRPPADPATVAPAITSFLDDLAKAFELDGTATVDVTEDGELEARLDGSGLGPLIGPGGEVIGAVQELARTVAQKESHGGRAPRLRVDVGGYRAERRTALAEFTRTTAEKVRETGHPHALEPMGSIDRKIVHDAAAEVEGVTTRSDGEEPSRRVIIAPA